MTINTVIVRPRYTVYATPSANPQAYMFDKIAGHVKHRRRHQDEYTLHDWVHLCDYVNDRVSGYPVPSALLTLRSKHNEDRRQADASKPINTGRFRANLASDRRRPARGKGRAARK
jgi:hypothetical protein